MSSVQNDLKSLRGGLLRLHGVLLAAERALYEREYGRVPAAEMLQLLLHDERFQWLRPLSGLVAEIDGALAEARISGEPVGPEYAADLLARASAALAPQEPAGSRYQNLLQVEPDAVLAHAEVARTLRDAGVKDIVWPLN